MQQRRFLFTTVFAIAIGALWTSYPAAAASERGQKKTRCGWFINPTPGNVWLLDKDEEWAVSIQGGHQAAGDWPAFKKRDWVRTNGSYGYGCACMVVVDRKASKEILQIFSSHSLPLKTCQRDASLKRPDA